MRNLELPKLNRLTPTLDSTFEKIGEEMGEVAECLGKYRNASGEQNSISDDFFADNLTSELIDVAQTCISMIFVLEENYKVSIKQIKEKTKGSTKFKEISINLDEKKINTSLSSLYRKMSIGVGKIALWIDLLNICNNTLYKQIILRKIYKELYLLSKSCTKMIFSVERNYSISIEDSLDNHIKKLIKRGYLG